MLRKRVLAGLGTHLLANVIRTTILETSPSVINRSMYRCAILDATAVQEGSRRLVYIRVVGNPEWCMETPQSLQRIQS